MGTNEFTHNSLTNYTRFMADRMRLVTRQHYTTLPGSVASYGKCTQTRTFEIHANLLGYLTDLIAEPRK